MSYYKKLIKGILNNDFNSKSELYNKFSAQMYTICLRYISKKEDAEDVFQNTFIKVFDKVNQVNNPESLPGWIKKMFINECLNFLRKENNKRNLISINDLTNETSHSENRIIEDISSEEILELINQLPDKYKLVFNLYVFEGYKHKEIAEKLNISVGTSKSNLHDARKIISNKLTKMNTIKKLRV